jgi:sulfatase modifying factor 1
MAMHGYLLPALVGDIALSRAVNGHDLLAHYLRRNHAMHHVHALRRPLAAVASLVMLVSGSTVATAGVVGFGSGANAFTMEFVPIGNPGNPTDTTGRPNPAGAVGYVYNMGKFEVSRDMVTKANAVGGLGIPLFDMTSFGGNGVNRPATGVSWNEAARFVNWLNVSQGFSPAYKFTTQPGGGGYSANANISLWVSGDAGFNADNPFRNSLAQYFLPSVNEWYKAAYYNPTSGTYFDYPTGSNSAPTAVASGTAANTAVYQQAFATGPADITLAGGLSPYGIMGQGGNVFELDETESDLVNDSSSSARGFRGGYWGDFISSELLALNRRNDDPALEDFVIGFRVASIPEPTSLLLGVLTSAGVLLRRRR